MAFTSDFSHIWFVGGFGGHGMPFGLRFGQLLAEAVVNERLPTALTPFRLSRPTLQEHLSSAVSTGISL